MLSIVPRSRDYEREGFHAHERLLPTTNKDEGGSGRSPCLSGRPAESVFVGFAGWGWASTVSVAVT